MQIRSASEARAFGTSLAGELQAGSPSSAYRRLAPVLIQRVPFRLLDLIGERITGARTAQVQVFLEEIAGHATMGGWVVIASALRAALKDNFAGSLSACRRFILEADVWYACDCFGERVAGSAMVFDLPTARGILESWKTDGNRWVRRAVGVAGHFWAKRAHGNTDLAGDVVSLLNFYRSLLGEKDPDAAGGVGWALKTLGRYYPEHVSEYLQAVNEAGVAITPLIRRKALKFLPPQQAGA